MSSPSCSSHDLHTRQAPQQLNSPLARHRMPRWIWVLPRQSSFISGPSPPAFYRQATETSTCSSLSQLVIPCQCQAPHGFPCLECSLLFFQILVPLYQPMKGQARRVRMGAISGIHLYLRLTSLHYSYPSIPAHPSEPSGGPGGRVHPWGTLVAKLVW